MALNLFGLGFIFGAKDQASPTIKKTGDQLEFANQAFTNLETTARTSKFNAIINSWQSIQLNNLIDQMDQVASKISSPELSTGLESTFASYQKGFAQMTATTNMSSTEVKKWGKIVGSVAYGLDMDMGSATKTFEDFRKMNIDVTKVVSTGKKSSKAAFGELLKAMEVLGLQSEDLSKIYGGLTKGFGLTTAQVRGLGDWMAYAGKQSGDASGVMKSWPGIIEAINAEGADFIKTLKPEQILSMAQGITKFGIALNKGVGTPMGDAQQQATAMFVTMTKMQKDLENMALGMGQDMGQFGELLVNSGGDIQGMFAAIQKDPLEFVKFFKKVVAEADKDGSHMQAMAARLKKGFFAAFGDDATHLLTANEKQLGRVTQALSKIPPMGEKTAGSMAKMGKAYRTTLTHADRMERIQQAFEHRMFGIVKRGGAMNKFLVRQRKNYKSMGDTIDDLSKGDGPIAGLTNALLRVKHLGLAGLSDKFGPVLDTIGNVAMQGAPVVTMLGSMGLRFQHLGKFVSAPLAPFKLLNKATGGIGGKLLSVFGPLGIAVTALGYFSKSGGDAFKGFAKKFGEDLPNEIAKIATKWGPQWLKDIFAPFVSMEKGKVVAKGVKWSAIGEAFLTGFNKAFDWLAENFSAGKELLARMINRVAEGISKIDWANVFNKAISGIIKVGEAIFEGIGSLLGAIFGGGDTQGAMEANALGMGAPMGKGLKAAVNNAFSAMGQAVRTGLKALWERFMNFWSDESVPFTDKLGKIGKTLGGVLVGGMVLSGGLRKKVLGSFGNMFGALRKKKDACQMGEGMAGCFADRFGGGMGKRKKGLLAGIGGLFMRKKMQPVAEQAGEQLSFDFTGGVKKGVQQERKGLLAGVGGLFSRKNMQPVAERSGKQMAFDFGGGIQKGQKGMAAGVGGLFAGPGIKQVAHRAGEQVAFDFGGGLDRGAKKVRKSGTSMFSGLFSRKGLGKAGKSMIGGIKGMGKKVASLGPSMGKMLLGGFGVGILTTAVMGLPKLIGRVSETVMSDSLSASEKAMGISEGVFNWFTGMLGISSETSSAIWGSMVDTMSNMIFRFAEGVRFVWTQIKLGWNAVSTFITEMGTKIWGFLSYGFHGVAAGFFSFTGGIRIAFSKMAGFIREKVSSLVEGVKEKLFAFLHGLPDILLPESIKKGLTSMDEASKKFMTTQPQLYRKMKGQLISEGKDPKPWRVAMRVQSELNSQARKNEMTELKKSVDAKVQYHKNQQQLALNQDYSSTQAAEQKKTKMAERLNREAHRAKMNFLGEEQGIAVKTGKAIGKGITMPKKMGVRVKPEKGEMAARLADSTVSLSQPKDDPRLKLMNQNNQTMQHLAAQMAELKAQIAKGQHVKIELAGDMNKIFKAVSRQAGRRFAQNPV